MYQNYPLALIQQTHLSMAKISVNEENQQSLVNRIEWVKQPLKHLLYPFSSFSLLAHCGWGLLKTKTAWHMSLGLCT